MKISDIIAEFERKGRPFYSFEFFPPKTEPGVHNLYARLDRMAHLEPAFIDVTWGAGGSTSDLSLEISKNAQKFFGLEVMMHLTCTNIDAESLQVVLNKAKNNNIQNILALRGDPPVGEREWRKVDGGFAYASDLIRFIKRNFPNDFGIAVGGYPEGHLEASSKDECVRYLKEKVDAGADLIVTQLFYDIEEFFDFKERCLSAGITCPILPGVLPIHNYERFTRFTEMCQIKVPNKVYEELQAIKSDDEAVRSYGVDLCVDMCQKLLDSGSPGLHFYTLNLESSVTEILDRLGLTGDCRNRRSLPWRPSTMPNRRKEDVRPIFWSNRPKSYLARTMSWDDFPNGRWGDSRSPSFGELNEYYLFRRGLALDSVKSSRLEMWGEPNNAGEVARVFVDFCRGKINRLPWCELPVQAETSRISSFLAELNQNGFLTINSQPQVNGASSSDPEVGWGGPHGIVYQKAYVEFFAPKDKLMRLLECCHGKPTITYHAVNVEGESYSNVSGRAVNAVTWGAFPGKEIAQPTVVDSESFMIWKDEAFQIWLDEWRYLYRPDSTSYKVLSDIYQNYFLVNIVENDYVNGSLHELFRPLLQSRVLPSTADAAQSVFSD